MAVFRKLLLTMNDSSLLFTRLVKTLLMQEVRTMGWKCDGLVESSAAFFLPSRCTMPTFHAMGMAWVVQQQLYMCSSAGNKEGHLLMMV